MRQLQEEVAVIEPAFIPEPQHKCGPNPLTGVWHDYWQERPGTVLECSECGKSWVAYRPHPMSGYMGVLWHREGWFAKWRRKRRERSK